ncbi:P-loop containing nucleoside triphosphate hydrolase protein [Mycena floridula]|nr:P-loop containing nucleoside triphosphate hydrolase protein [Mycena floridula]
MALELVQSHILESLSSSRPLFVAIQGPQGSGKSFLANLLQRTLSTSNSLRVAVLSLDDLYLPHQELVALSNKHPENHLWRGRGQPGTHDITLGVQVLQALKSGTKKVELPRFEKSLFDGEGDRLPMDGSGPAIEPPVDVVILEGWCTGFFPIPPIELDRRWTGSWRDERRKLHLSEDKPETKNSIQAINRKLHEYTQMWAFFDVMVQLKPAPSLVSSSEFSVIYAWRLEQEHNMKTRNGGKGMSDEAVKLFVDRYIPGYVFFGDTVSANSLEDASGADVIPTPRWLGKSLRILIDEKREIVDVERF